MKTSEIPDVQFLKRTESITNTEVVKFGLEERRLNQWFVVGEVCRACTDTGGKQRPKGGKAARRVFEVLIHGQVTHVGILQQVLIILKIEN